MMTEAQAILARFDYSGEHAAPVDAVRYNELRALSVAVARALLASEPTQTDMDAARKIVPCPHDLNPPGVQAPYCPNCTDQRAIAAALASARTADNAKLRKDRDDALETLCNICVIGLGWTDPRGDNAPKEPPPEWNNSEKLSAVVKKLREGAAAAEARVRELEEALLKYGRHTSDCGFHSGHDCLCGIEDWRRALGGSK